MDSKARNSEEDCQTERPPSFESTSSMTSYFSTRTTCTFDEPPQEACRSESVDLENSSLYPPSSISTDYGLYYTRWALSEEELSEWSNHECCLYNPNIEQRDDTITISEDMSPSIVSGTEESIGEHRTNLLQGASADSEYHKGRKFLDETVRNMSKNVKTRPAHRLICYSWCEAENRRVRWVTTLLAMDGHVWRGSGNTGSYARKKALGKALNHLANKLGYQFDMDLETHQCSNLLILLCRLLGLDRLKYVARKSKSKLYRTSYYTCIIIIDSQHYVWATGSQLDIAKERTAAYALADLNDKYPSHLPCVGKTPKKISEVIKQVRS
ncbi:hypothetical protein GALMADRAFT_259147 [Galerina marginata CBS 339.88]|uniref:Uncharacterized protein n=1 Tax=Galerina marginata (strain CBS 339.88) TaxID=685588 RepID=A0A067S748_GALM3|nr:hypothetical protein GALMADRAFT_259147 [Galerina marginata CBS 339.88]